VKGEDGKPVELGRGAMGVTYKAVDVDLQYPVTLKVISEKYLGDESARLRFLREARAAASVRHPNVASVFHLGRTGENYFYAMEFVEGETLENRIKHSGRLEVKLAMEIATQVITGAIDARRRITHQSLQKTPSTSSRAATGEPPTRLGPEKISVARLPVTGSDVFGRGEDIAFLDRAWAKKDVNVVRMCVTKR
jgi:serine/threonine protein kinase